MFSIILLLSSFVFSQECNVHSYGLGVDYYTPPYSTGTYYYLEEGNKLAEYKEDNFFYFNKWQSEQWSRKCKIKNVTFTAGYDGPYSFSEHIVCTVLKLYCDVKELDQFPGIKYTDMNGYRENGTLRWSRTSKGSTDIFCYDKNGIGITKRVNNPAFCK